MKKILVIVSIAMLLLVSMALAAKPNKCTTIQSGELLDSQGEVITTGYNDFGYNYQAHMYNGDYGYPGWNLVMKWNDAWLSNKDCDGDGKLDRPLDENGAQYYFGSGAWLTNHWTTTYEEVIDNETVECYYEDFIKIVALPVGAQLVEGVWYTADGDRIGETIWGQFAVVQEKVYDSCYPQDNVDSHEKTPGLGSGVLI